MTASNVPARLRAIILEGLQAGLAQANPDDVAALASAGIDSNSILIALKELGYKPTVYSFTINGWTSQDFLAARTNAARLKLPFQSIILPTDTPTLLKDIQHILRTGARKKTEIEVSWPHKHAFATITQQHVASGLAADGYFGLSKKAALHYRHRMDEFRAEYFQPIRLANQNHAINTQAKQARKTFHTPYINPQLLELFQGLTWDQTNKPRQKETIRQAFPELNQLQTRPHTNLQLGDSHIAKTLAKLHQDPNINTHARKPGPAGTAALYRDIATNMGANP